MEKKTLDIAKEFEPKWKEIKDKVPEVFMDNKMANISIENLYLMSLGFFLAGGSAVLNYDINMLKKINDK